MTVERSRARYARPQDDWNVVTVGGRAGEGEARVVDLRDVSESEGLRRAIVRALARPSLEPQFGEICESCRTEIADQPFERWGPRFAHTACVRRIMEIYESMTA